MCSIQQPAALSNSIFSSSPHLPQHQCKDVLSGLAVDVYNLTAHCSIVFPYAPRIVLTTLYPGQRVLRMLLTAFKLKNWSALVWRDCSDYVGSQQGSSVVTQSHPWAQQEASGAHQQGEALLSCDFCLQPARQLVGEALAVS